MLAPIPGSYDPLLVVLSFAIAAAASFTALDLAGRIRAVTGIGRWIWLATASIAMGGGIWSMHFVAMLAFSLPMPVSYDPRLTALSVVVAIVVTGVGFIAVEQSKNRNGLLALAIGGLLMGLGIVAMHYTGMAALQVPAVLVYDRRLVALSILIAVAASTAALWLASRDPSVGARVGAAGCMGLAISAMHYTGMAAASFCVTNATSATLATLASNALKQGGLAIAVTVATFLMLFLALLASSFDRRLMAAAQRETVRLRENEERFRSLYRNTPVPLHSLDDSGRISSVSEAWLDLLGFTEDEVIGRPLTEFMTEASAQRYRLQAGMLREAEHSFVTKSGRTLTILLSSREQPNLGHPGHAILGGLIDVTAHRSAEEALRHAQRMEAVGQLTGGVAHDFNNLMTTILGCIELLERRVVSDDKASSLFEAARRAIHRGAQLTESLLAFSRQQPLRPAPVDANALLQETATLIRRAVGETVVVELGFEPRLPNCLADATQLQAAVLNLAINARDAMPAGGVLSIRTADATLGPEDLGDNQDAKPGRFVVLTVRDTGCGMTPDVLARAFEPFFTTKPIGQGTGLGLSQVYGFVRQSCGHVSLVSSAGGGTSVTIYIPVAEASAAAQPAARPLADVVTVASATVLVVEDDAEVLEATAEVLRDAGWRVLTARDGVAALRILETEQVIDVLFSDVVMPGGIGGTELSRLAHRLHPGIGVVLTSGYPGLRQDALAEVREVLRKPYDRDELLARLGGATMQMTPAA